MTLNDILSVPQSPAEFHRSVRARWHEHEHRRGWSVRQTVQFINTHAPHLREQVLASAAEKLKGLQVLPGTAAKPYFVGNPPQWHANPVNDNEYVWGLNRMYHWPDLLRAYALTGEARYAEKVAGELHDWITSCPRPPLAEDRDAAWRLYGAVTPWRALEVGIRAFSSWPMVLDFLIDSPAFTPELLAQYAVALYQHAEVLHTVSPILWPTAAHNHYLMENLGLLNIACLFPEFKHAELWRTHALRELERCAKAQLTIDGGQIEGCPHYHNGCVAWFCQSLTLAREFGVKLKKSYRERIRGSLEYAKHSFRPSGTSVPWGDSDADTLYIRAAIWNYCAFDDTWPLHFCQSIVGRDTVRERCLQAVWMIPTLESLLKDLDVPASSLPLSCVEWQLDLKQVMLRTDWTRDALSLFFACRTPVENGHAHIDPMGFDFTALGKPLLVDPGRYTYRDDADRRYFKSAAAHNTLLIDNREPFEYVNSWSFTPQKPSQIINVIDRSDFRAVIASHLNYEPAVHTRLAALVDNAALLVIDKVEALAPSATVQIYYHADSLTLTWDAKTNAAHTADADVNMAIHVAPTLSGTVLDGRISEHLDVAKPSKRLKLEDTSSATERWFATLVVPYPGSERPRVERLSVAARGERCDVSFILNGRNFTVGWKGEKARLRHEDVEG